MNEYEWTTHAPIPVLIPIPNGDDMMKKKTDTEIFRSKSATILILAL